MGKTSIEWTEATWNPLRGCSRVSEGCRNCYAETVANRFSGSGQPYQGLIAKGGQWNGAIKLVPEKLLEPWRWVKPRMIFVNSMSDLFHPAVPFEYIAAVFYIMSVTTRHTYQVLTKRPERMVEFFRWAALRDPYECDGIDDGIEWVAWHGSALEDLIWEPATANRGGYDNCGPGFPYENVWLGVSVEDQATAEERIPLLLQAPAAVRWISAEPLLGPINLMMVPGSAEQYLDGSHVSCLRSDTRLDWVVVGGESGTKVRPMHPEWVRSLRDQCFAAGTPFFFKQWGEYAPSPDGGLPDGLPDSAGYYFEPPRHAPHKVWRFGKKRAGRTLDGREWSQYPAVKQQSEVA